MNKIVISGGITADAKKVTENLTTASLAVTRAPRNGEEKGTTDYIELLYLGKQAAWAESYIKKGNQIIVEGRLQNDVYTDKEGKSRTRTQVVVSDTRFADVKANNSVNTVILSGGITADAKRVSDALATSHSLAVNRPVSGEAQTDYFDLLHLGAKRAAFAETYLKKGTRLLVIGSLQMNTYTDKDGVKRTQAQIIAASTEFIGAKVTATPTVVAVEEDEDDDIPFN